jgi:hypothetical protein
MTQLISVFVILVLCSCNTNTIKPDPQGYACGKVITTEFSVVTAPIAYSSAIDSYYISWPSSTVDTTTNRVISVFCNLPDDYKVVGKVMKFSGSFAQLDDTTGTEGLIKRTFNTKYANYVAIKKIY